MKHVDDYKHNNNNNNNNRLTYSKGRSPNSTADEPKLLVGQNTVVC